MCKEPDSIVIPINPDWLGMERIYQRIVSTRTRLIVVFCHGLYLGALILWSLVVPGTGTKR